MNLRDQIAAARTLADDWAIADGDVRNSVETLATLLERACELLEDAAENSLYPGKRAIVRAFLSGEVK